MSVIARWLKYINQIQYQEQERVGLRDPLSLTSLAFAIKLNELLSFAINKIIDQMGFHSFFNVDERPYLPSHYA